MSIKIIPIRKPINKINYPDNTKINKPSSDLNIQYREKEINKQSQEEKLFAFLEREAITKKAKLFDASKIVVQEITDDKGNIRYVKYSDGTIQTFKNERVQIEIRPDHTSVGYYSNGNIKFETETDGTLRTFYPSGVLKEVTYPDGETIGYGEDGAIQYEISNTKNREYNYTKYKNEA